MKSIAKVAGLCLASMLVVSMAFSANASALVWEHCTKGAVAGLTKWTDHNCSTASGTGEWQWKEINNTEEVRIKGSLLLLDSKVPILGEVSVECSGEGVGSVGPGKFDRINEIKTSPAQCVNNKGCEHILKAEARNLPWQSELVSVENKLLIVLTGTVAGKEPGWLVECETLGVAKADECVQEGAEKEERLELANKATGTELLVLATFEQDHKAKCSLGGKESGSVKGSLAILQANGWGLRVS